MPQSLLPQCHLRIQEARTKSIDECARCVTRIAGLTFPQRVNTNFMIAFEVTLNGKRVCIAGAEDLGVLAAHVTASGMLGKKTSRARPDETTPDLFYSVGGLTSRQDPKKNVHANWKSVEALRVGDVLQIRIIETEKADRARSRHKAKRPTRKTRGSK
jgi:hypothetical protein